MDAKEQELVRTDEDYMLWLQTEHWICKTGFDDLEARQRSRIPYGFVPILKNTGISDRENNTVYHTVVYSEQAEDVLKALRKWGLSARTFNYDLY